jgi:dolichyl-phosphate-mannose--protein O-mannosyl transferase
MIFWWKEEDQNWLMLASVFTALMLSTKYLGSFGAGIIGLLFIYIVITEKRRLSGKTIIALGLPFLIITLPWYLRNLIWDYLFSLLRSLGI